MVEQYHGKTAVVHRVHPDYVGEHLKLRAWVLLFYSYWRPMIADQVTKQLKLRIGILKKKKPLRVSGTSILIKRTVLCKGPKSTAFDRQRSRVEGIMKIWVGISQLSKIMYTNRAKERGRANLIKINEEISRLEPQLVERRCFWMLVISAPPRGRSAKRATEVRTRIRLFGLLVVITKLASPINV